jgi:hypothetical protein
LTAAVALGVAVALQYLRPTSPRGAFAGVIHGLTGALGFGLLIIALQGPRRGDAMGAGSFGIAAAVLFGLALLFGPFVRVLVRRFPRAAGLVLATHASIALTGFVLFLAWASL